MQITHPQNVFKKREKVNMSDDLVKRLREVGGMSDDGATRWYINPDGPEAADRIEKLEAALRWICGSRTIEYFDGTVQADETKMLWTYRRIARETLEGIYDERIFKDPT